MTHSALNPTQMMHHNDVRHEDEPNLSNDLQVHCRLCGATSSLDKLINHTKVLKYNKFT